MTPIARVLLRLQDSADGLIPWRFVKFALVGVVNTLVGLTVIFSAKAFLGWGDLAANILGYAVGLTVSFVLNRNWTFRHRGSIDIPVVARFVLVFLCAYGINLAAVFGFRDLGNVDSYLAQAIGMIPYSIFFYFGSRHFVFPAEPGQIDHPRKR